MIYFGAQNDPEIVPLGPIFNAPLKIAQIDMYTKTDVKPLKNFGENYQRPAFFSSFWGPKWPTNLTCEAHVLHTTKSTCNDHVK